MTFIGPFWLSFWRCFNKVIPIPITIHPRKIMKIGSCDIVWFCFHSLSDQVAPQRIHTWASKHILNSRRNETKRNTFHHGNYVPRPSCSFHFRCCWRCAKGLQDFFSLIFKAIFQKPHRVRIVLSLQKLREVELAQDVGLNNDTKIYCLNSKHKNMQKLCSLCHSWNLYKSCFQGTTEPRCFLVSALKEAKDGKYACKFSTA